MPQDSESTANIRSPQAADKSAEQCSFCRDGVKHGGGTYHRGELLCASCAEIAASARRVRKPASIIASRAAAIDTYAMATTRVTLAAISGLILVAGSTIISVLVYHGTRDTWERDHRDKLLALMDQARALLDDGNRPSALAKYNAVLKLTGDRQLRDRRLRDAQHAAREKKLELERMLADEQATRREEQEALAEAETRKRRDAEAAEQRRREEERQRQEEAARRELARQQEQKRREQLAKKKPIEISDIGVKLVDSTPSMDFCTYSWKATITNRTAAPVSISVVLTLYDDEGYELGSDYKFGVVVGAGRSESVTGKSMTTLSTFDRAVKFGVSIR